MDMENLNQQLRNRFGDKIKVQIKSVKGGYVYTTKHGYSQKFNNPNDAYEGAKDYLDNITIQDIIDMQSEQETYNYVI